MRVAQRDREPVEAHFTEGEPDLEPPEELAIAELDEQSMLEEDLDNEDLLEEDVDDDVLEVSLEGLVHSDDGDDDVDVVEHLDGGLEWSTGAAGRGRAGAGRPGRSDGGRGAAAGGGASGPAAGADRPRRDAGADTVTAFDDADGPDDDEDDSEVEEALDLVLLARMAITDGADGADAGGTQTVALLARADTLDLVDGVAPCRPDEFVCRTCFLVRSRVQLADGKALVCRDCLG